MLPYMTLSSFAILASALNQSWTVGAEGSFHLQWINILVTAKAVANHSLLDWLSSLDKIPSRQIAGSGSICFLVMSLAILQTSVQKLLVVTQSQTTCRYVPTSAEHFQHMPAGLRPTLCSLLRARLYLRTVLSCVNVRVTSLETVRALIQTSSNSTSVISLPKSILHTFFNSWKLVFVLVSSL